MEHRDDYNLGGVGFCSCFTLRVFCLLPQGENRI